MHRPAPSPMPSGQPEVILDFTVDDGRLTVQLKNIGQRPAYAVKTRFDRPFCGPFGATPITEMRFLKKVEFLAPGKQLAQFVDLLSSYKRRRQPMRLTATVSYRDREGRRFEDRIVHDLRIYLELGQALPIARNTLQGE